MFNHFFRSLCNSVKVNNANTLTDCNGDLVDAANTRQTSDSAPNSTVLFSLAAYPVRIDCAAHQRSAI